MTRARSDEKKIMLIANPSAGKGSLRKDWEKKVQPFLLKTLKEFDFQFTESSGDATIKTRQAIKDGYQMIVSMGGDGTLNEVVNGFFENDHMINPNATLGILPFGSGGDFIRSLPLERDFRKAVLHLISPKIKKIDVGRLEFSDKKIPTRYFINISDAGLVASIMKRVNHLNRSWPSNARYVTGSLQGFFDYQNIKVKLQLVPKDSKQPLMMVTNMTNLMVANGQYFGSGMRAAPDAKLDDGLFEVVVLKNFKTLDFLILLPKLYLKKKKIKSDLYSVFQTDEIKIEVLDQKHPLHIETDGETHGEGSLTYKILSRVLQIVI